MKKLYKFLLFLLIPLLNHSQKVFSQTTTYIYTGSVQTYTVAAGVTSIGVDAVGAMGGQYSVPRGGYGGRVQCTLNVTPLSVYYIYVGGAGGTGTAGFNGGGATVGGTAGGGGGATDMRIVSGPPTTTNRPVVAGGGGGGTANYGTPNYDRGGNGGGLTGENGYTDNVFSLGPTQSGATGGSGIAGGIGGTQPGYGAGFPGTVGVGGAGATGTWGTGGGGGYYGGGGGSWDGGGGGSSYTDPIAVTAFSHTQGYNTTGNGWLVINVLCSTPTAGTIVGPGNVCAGSDITLTDPTGTAGGTWSSTSSGVATVNSASGLVTGVSSGTVTISYTIALSCGTAVATTSLTVNPLPLSVSGPANVCVGSSITLADAATGGSWSSSATTVAGIDPSSGTVLGLTQGTSTIVYTLPTGCSISTVISVNSPPSAITGPSSVCMGSPATMSNTATGGTWSSSPTTIATIDATGLVTPVSPGPVLITYANGCGAPATRIVTINPLPESITGVTSLCITASSSLSDATGGGGIWSSTSTTIASIGSVSGVVTGLAGGTTTISYTLPTSCAATTVVTVIPPLAPISGPQTVCTGSTSLLGGLPAGGTWVSGNTSLATIGSSSGIVTGVSMGTSVITYTAGIGCSATLEITINPQAPIVGVDSVCVGGTTFLTDIVGGGTWSTSDASVATTVLDSGRVTGLIPGSVTITYFLPTGCQSSKEVSVVDYPDPITGTTKTCPGFATTLFDMVPGGGVWSSSNTSVATVGQLTGIVTGVNADTVSINYTIRPGCAVKAVVTVNPLPAVITGSTPICPGTTDSLQDITPGGLWSSHSTSLATVIDTSGVVIALAGGAAVISYTLPTGCYRTKTISIDPVPVPDVSYSPVTNTIYADTMPNFVSYQWYDSIQGEIIGAISPNVAALYNEYYFVVVTDTNGCKGASSLFHYNPAMTGVSATINSGQIKIYPNPVSGTLFIKSQARVNAVISGIDGKTELEQEDAKEIDVSHLAEGMYLIRLYNSSGELQMTQKFTKE